MQDIGRKYNKNKYGYSSQQVGAVRCDYGDKGVHCIALDLADEGYTRFYSPSLSTFVCVHPNRAILLGCGGPDT